jgi:hypothetical protein
VPGPDRDQRRDPVAAPLGGVVERTGLALVRRGELILPAEGSEAEVTLAEQDARHEIHVHLPVVIEVVGERDALAVERVADNALRRVRMALESRPVGG